jgi:uncharacterized lipoprotein YajG
MIRHEAAVYQFSALVSIFNYSSITKLESIMKIYTLLIMAIVALAGCSTSYKGSIQTSNPDASKSGSFVASQETGHSAVLINR